MFILNAPTNHEAAHLTDISTADSNRPRLAVCCQLDHIAFPLEKALSNVNFICLRLLFAIPELLIYTHAVKLYLVHFTIRGNH